MSFYRRWLALFFIAFAYLAIVQLYHAYAFTIDDAFISLKYAKRLALHQGLYWNIGEKAVEGYSNFLYVVLGTIFLSLKLDAINALKQFALVTLCLTLFGLYRLARFWLPRALALLPIILLLFYPGEILWTVSGLETPLYQCIIIYASYFMIKGLRSCERLELQKHAFVFAGGFLALASLTRPEGPMFFLLFSFICYLYTKTPIEKQCRVLQYRGVKLFIISFALCYTPYLLWHYYYFHRLFANPVYCKALAGSGEPFQLSLDYLLLITPLLLTSIPYIKNKYHPQHLFLLLPSVCYLVMLMHADPIVGFLNRHTLTAYALFTPLAIAGLNYLFQWQTPFIKKYTRYWLCFAFCFFAGFSFISGGFTPKAYTIFAIDSQKGQRLRKELASWLNDNARDEIAVSDCGLIPYYFNGKVIDTYCLNSLQMTTPPISRAYPRFVSWLLEKRKPNMIILAKAQSAAGIYLSPADKLIYHHLAFKQNYQLIKTLSTHNARERYQYLIYRRLTS